MISTIPNDFQSNQLMTNHIINNTKISNNNFQKIKKHKQLKIVNTFKTQPKINNKILNINNNPIYLTLFPKINNNYNNNNYNNLPINKINTHHNQCQCYMMSNLLQ